MEYGLIAKKLGHSFSKEVHALIADYEYELKELSIDELKEFMDKADFKAINVTIPYKEEVMPYLHHIDEAAKLIGSVLPILAKKIGFDPAVMASPLITTAVDAISLVIYFAVAMLLLEF